MQIFTKNGHFLKKIAVSIQNIIIYTCIIWFNTMLLVLFIKFVLGAFH